MVHSTSFRLLSSSLVLAAVVAGCGEESGGGSGSGEGGAGVTSSATGATSGGPSGPSTGAGAGSSTSSGDPTSSGPSTVSSGPSTVTSVGSGGGGPVECEADPNSIYAQTAIDFSTLETVDLCDYQGEVLLIANIAANCGYTYQMADLQYLHDFFGGEGLRVLGFISNDFGGQAGSTEELEACNAKHGITFQEFDRAPVLNDPQPVFAWLQAQPNPGPAASLAPSWNFNKYIISRSGQLVGKYSEGEAWGTDSTAPAFDASLAVQKIREQLAVE